MTLYYILAWTVAKCSCRIFIPVDTQTRFTAVLRNVAYSHTWTFKLVQPTLTELAHTLDPLKQPDINKALMSVCKVSREKSTQSRSSCAWKIHSFSRVTKWSRSLTHRPVTNNQLHRPPNTSTKHCPSSFAEICHRIFTHSQFSYTREVDFLTHVW